MYISPIFTSSNKPPKPSHTNKTSQAQKDIYFGLKLATAAAKIYHSESIGRSFMILATLIPDVIERIEDYTSPPQADKNKDAEPVKLSTLIRGSQIGASIIVDPVGSVITLAVQSALSVLVDKLFDHGEVKDPVIRSAVHLGASALATRWIDSGGFRSIFPEMSQKDANSSWFLLSHFKLSYANFVNPTPENQLYVKELCWQWKKDTWLLHTSAFAAGSIIRIYEEISKNPYPYKYHGVFLSQSS